MNNYKFIGVDIAKSKFDAVIFIEDRAISAVFENNESGFKRFLAWVNKHTKQEVWVCLEATGCYSEGIAEFLDERDMKVSIVNPMQIKNYAKSILSRNKNDQLDAKIIARYAESGEPLRQFKPKSAEQKELKETLQLIETLEKQRRQLKNQLETIRCRKVKAELKKLIRALDLRIKALEKSSRELVEENSEFSNLQDQLTGIVGIGEKTAKRLLAYLPDISHFKNAKQLAAYAGLSPRQFQSGSYVGKTRLSKFGNAQLRKSLYMSALVAKNSNKHLQPFCDRLRRNGLSPKEIICAVMRKLLHIIFGMLKNKQDFNSQLV